MTNHQFDWLSYLEIADHLLHQSGEGFYRSAASRAYYGVFCHIRDALFSRGGVSHVRVINALKSNPRPEVALLGQDLEYLRHERNNADYQTYTGFDASRAEAALFQARSIGSRAANLLP